MDGKSWYINNLTSLAIYYLTNIFFLVFLQLNLSIICFCKCKIYCFCLPRTVAFIAVAMFLRSNTYALRPSLCVGIPRQINSLTQGHCEGRPSVGLGTRMGSTNQDRFSIPCGQSHSTMALGTRLVTQHEISQACKNCLLLAS